MVGRFNSVAENTPTSWHPRPTVTKNTPVDIITTKATNITTPKTTRKAPVPRLDTRRIEIARKTG